MTARDERFRAGLLLGGLVIALWAHAAVPGAGGAGIAAAPGGTGMGPEGTALGPGAAAFAVGAGAGALALLGLARFAAGIDGFRAAALVPALLAAASPAVAASLASGGREPLVAALYVAGAYRAFAETHVAGRLPVSALLFGAGAALAPAGPAVLVLVFMQKLAFARRFQLGRASYVFAGAWIAVALAAWILLRVAIGGAPAPLPGTPPAGPGPVLLRFWREVDGLALLPFLLFLLAGWKSKAVIFRLSLAASVLAAALADAALAPAAALPRSLAPALLFAFLVAAEALAAAGAAVEAGGLRGRARTALFAATLGALALGQLWPTLGALAR